MTGCLPSTPSGARGPIERSFRSLVLVCLLGGLSPGDAEAQDSARDFTRPILVLNSGGHHAPVRSLLFTPEGGQLLSGGLDKVINVWGLREGRPELEATIRPPIGRGSAGCIYAMALSPTADERGQRVLAVAGFGVEARRGNIRLFHFPGSPAIKTGDHFAQLMKDEPNDPGPSGHSNTVTSLAFHPRGTLLASGSNDATARIWDWKARRARAVLKGHVGPINALAFTPAGKQLITGGRDGTLRLWDINRPAGPVRAAPPPRSRTSDPLGVQINTLAISGDGRWVVIGREDGQVLRYDAATLANAIVLSAKEETIESLALSHDGRTLVTSAIGQLKDASELPRLACSIQVQDMPDGRNRRPLLTLDNVAYACGFCPDDRTLAVAGGDRQSIFLISNWWDRAGIKTMELKGQGRSIWDVGLRDDGGRLAVGFSHDPDRNLLFHPAPAPREKPRYRGMILPSREVAEIDPAELSRGLLAFEGWTVRPVDQFHLVVSRANRPGRPFPIALDEEKDRRWKCYSFIPPGPNHPRPALAVGCATGVWFYRLEDGQPTRSFSGHGGPVYCLAPSKDGRWLATGSSDQTIRLWTLAGCDTLPTLGATFERLPTGNRVVKAVEPLSFAEAMGLQVGDVTANYALARQIVTGDDFFKRLESQVPNTPIELVVRRKVKPAQGPTGEEVIPLYTTKRDGPSLSLFLGEEREWVIWMPSGYYDTSIAGDKKFLGWHLNQATIFEPRPTDFLEINKFEWTMRQPRLSQPNKLDTFLQTGDMELSLAVPFPPPGPGPQPPPSSNAPSVVVERGQPPAIVPTIQHMPGQQVTAPDGKPIDEREAAPEKISIGNLDSAGKGALTLSLAIDAKGRSPARSVEYRVDGLPLRPSRVFAPPIATHRETVALALDPGPHRFTAEVWNEEGVKRSTNLDIFVRGQPRLRATHLRVISLAPAFRDRLLPSIPYAERDLRDLKAFFARHLVSPAGGGPLSNSNVDEAPLVGNTATVARFRETVETLERQPLDEGDLVVVVIESHFLNAGRERMIAAADSKFLPPAPPSPAIPADELAAQLGKIAQQKCKVLVLLDCVHPDPDSNPVWDNDIIDWVRNLRDEQNVITFVASNSGPGPDVTAQGHRAFAQAVLDSVRASKSKGGPYLMNDFRDIVIENVLNLTNRQQQAACYLPDGINGLFPILDPRPVARK